MNKVPLPVIVVVAVVAIVIAVMVIRNSTGGGTPEPKGGYPTGPPKEAGNRGLGGKPAGGGQ